MRLLLASLLAVALAPATAAAQGPTATTGAAEGIGAASVTLTGTVTPGPAASTAHFELGTSTLYGVATPGQSVAAGTDPVPLQATVNGLSPDTTYHYRLVAGDDAGADRTFKTAAAPVNPALPSIARLRTVEKTQSTARLTARITPNRSVTTWHVEWGRSTAFGNRTPDQTLQPGQGGGVTVGVGLEALPSFTKLYWRVVAANAAGVRRSGTATFTTLRDVSGISLSVAPDTAVWSGRVTLSGRIGGAGVNGLPVALEQSAFPFDAGFHQVGTARTNRTGVFRFASRDVFLATRFRAVTGTTPSATSTEVGVRVRVRASLHRARGSRRFQRLAGSANPGLPTGSATLQRQTRTGAWVRWRRTAVAPAAETVSTYGFRVKRSRRAVAYRVRVRPHDAGAHLAATTRTVVVAPRRARGGGSAR